jgi:hypothetical protein
MELVLDAALRALQVLLSPIELGSFLFTLASSVRKSVVRTYTKSRNRDSINW